MYFSETYPMNDFILVTLERLILDEMILINLVVYYKYITMGTSYSVWLIIVLVWSSTNPYCEMMALGNLEQLSV